MNKAFLALVFSKKSIKFNIEVCLKYKAFMESSFKGFSFSLTFFAQATSGRPPIELLGSLQGALEKIKQNSLKEVLPAGAMHFNGILN